MFIFSVLLFIILIFIYKNYRKWNIFTSNRGGSQTHRYTSTSKRIIDDEYNASKNEKKKEIDRILDKIYQYGIDSLTIQERGFIDENSDKI